MLKLYHNEMSVCAQKVRIVLAEKNLAWESVHLNLFAGEARTVEYKKLNPNGVVPTLITEDGEVIIESTIITEYLDDAFPLPSIKPPTPYLTAQTRLWAKKIDDWVHAGTATVSNAVAFRFKHLEGKTEEEIKQYYNAIPDPARRERLWDLAMNGTDSKYFSTTILQFEALFKMMDLTLTEHTWLAGENYSLADIALTPYIARFDHLALMKLFDNRPAIVRWYNKVRERDSYKTAIEDWLDHDLVSFMSEKGQEAFGEINSIIHTN